MRNNKLWIVWGILVVLGTIYSVYDYKVWKKIETEKFGQGWEGQRPVAEIAPLVGPYINKVWRTRIKYPKDWTLKENIDYSETNLLRKSLPQAGKRVSIVEFSNPINSVIIKVWGEIIPNKDLVDIVTKEAVATFGDREYINSDRSKFIVIHWESSTEIKYQAYSKSSEIVYIVEGKSGPMEAGLMRKTMISMLEALVQL